MYRIDVDSTHAIVAFVVEGVVPLDEIEHFCEELRLAVIRFTGREVKIKADMRAFRPAAPEVAERIREVQEFGLKVGVKRVAEMVESEIVALQLGRVARESGTDRILRRFADDDAATAWLMYGGDDDENDAPPRSRDR